MNKTSEIAAFLIDDPKRFLQVSSAHWVSRFRKIPAGLVQKRVNGLQFEYDFGNGFHPNLKRMYLGTYEPLVVAAMQRIVRPGDTFLDVGASIGFMTMIAAGLVGKSGQVHSFEPNPQDYEKLEKFRSLNPGHQIVCHPLACGEKPGEAPLDLSSVLGWNTLVPNFMRKDVWKDRVKVPMIRLDDYLREQGEKLGKISMIKIDTEGYELFVLKGLRDFFEKGRDRPAIICEVTPRVNELMNISPNELEDYMTHYGYSAYRLWDRRTKIRVSRLTKQADVLFLPDPR